MKMIKMTFVLLILTGLGPANAAIAEEAPLTLDIDARITAQRDGSSSENSFSATIVTPPGEAATIRHEYKPSRTFNLVVTPTYAANDSVRLELIVSERSAAGEKRLAEPVIRAQLEEAVTFELHNLDDRSSLHLSVKPRR